jgi:hypothetical protein
MPKAWFVRPECDDSPEPLLRLADALLGTDLLHRTFMLNAAALRDLHQLTVTALEPAATSTCAWMIPSDHKVAVEIIRKPTGARSANPVALQRQNFRVQTYKMVGLNAAL